MPGQPKKSRNDATGRGVLDGERAWSWGNPQGGIGYGQAESSHRRGWVGEGCWAWPGDGSY